MATRDPQDPCNKATADAKSFRYDFDGMLRREMITAPEDIDDFLRIPSVHAHNDFVVRITEEIYSVAEDETERVHSWREYGPSELDDYEKCFRKAFRPRLKKLLLERRASMVSERKAARPTPRFGAAPGGESSSAISSLTLIVLAALASLALAKKG